MPGEIIIISGGQTGADRAALDWAIKYSVPHGGWCPNGREALDGRLDAKYLLKETPTAESLERTEWNVRDSDATVIFTLAPKAMGGTQKTLVFARKQKKPSLHLHKGMLAVSEKLVTFLGKHHVRRLNVAGSSEAEEPGIYAWVSDSLEKVKMLLER
jgi:hypothetical protein